MGTVTEKYTAIVTTNEDPDQRGKIKVACLGLLGDETTEIPIWVEPVHNWGWFTIPDIGEQVEIEVATDSDLDEIKNQTFIDSPRMIWRAKRFYADEPEDPAVATPVHNDFKTNYGKRRGFATPNGHILLFDDTEDNQKVMLSWKQEETYCYLTFDENGSVIIANKTGSLIFMDAVDGANSIIDEHGNTISSNTDGMKVIDKFSNIIELKEGVVQVLSQGNMILNASNISLEGASVDIVKGATDPVVKGTIFKTYNDTHTHSSSVGPTGPPIVPLPPTALSTAAKVK
jgi:hypothetical protein